MEDQVWIKLIIIVAILFVAFLVAVTAKLYETFKNLDKGDEDGER